MSAYAVLPMSLKLFGNNITCASTWLPVESIFLLNWYSGGYSDAAQPEKILGTNILVVGATGVAGSAFVEHVLKQQACGACNWRLTGVTRRADQVLPNANSLSKADNLSQRVSYIQADLIDDYSNISCLRDVTHVVFAGFVPAADFAKQLAPNRQILSNCIKALQACPLQRIVLIQGMKYYGSHLGAFKTPAREDDPRHEGENYYYAQQDFLETCGVEWTCLRPHVICGTTSIGTPQNILTVIGAYASLMKASGNPLCWPGTEQSFAAINQATDASLLARAITWSLESPGASNQAFNVTNGDFFRWQHLWPKIADLFAIPTGPVAMQNLSEVMPPLSGLWQQLVQQNELKPHSIEAIANWSFADYILRTGWDVMANTTKIRQAGFNDCLDTEKMYLDHLAALQAQQILPR